MYLFGIIISLPKCVETSAALLAALLAASIDLSSFMVKFTPTNSHRRPRVRTLHVSVPVRATNLMCMYGGRGNVFMVKCDFSDRF